MKNNTFKMLYKIIAFLMVLGFMIAAYALLMINKDWGADNNNNIPFAYGEFTAGYFSFFTTQSNLVVAGYFLLAIIFHKKEDSLWLTGQKAKIFVAGYISVTGTIWITVLLPVMLSQGSHSATTWVLAVEPHIFAPAAMIIYAVTNFGINKIEWKQYLKKDIWIYISYPIVYIICVMLRGEMRWADGKGNLSYPYPFLNYHKEIFGMPGVVGFIIFFIIILALFFAYNILYVFINNLKAKKGNKQPEVAKQKSDENNN